MDLPKIFCNRVLLVSPIYFGYDRECSEDDKFQKEPELRDEEVDELAKEEHKEYIKKIRKAGINVQIYLQHNVKAVSSIFPDWFTIQRGNICKEGLLTIFPMNHSKRRLERNPKIISELSKQCKHTLDLSHLEEKGEYLEGKGSLLYDHRNYKIYSCLSPRSSLSALEKYIQEINKISKKEWRAVPFKAKDKNGYDIYHTDCMMQILNSHVLLCEDTLEEKEKLIDELTNPSKNLLPHKNIVNITVNEMLHMCCNIINVVNDKEENVLLMSKQAYKNYTPDHRKILKENYKLVYTDLQTIEEAGGGSARCLLAEYF